VLSPTRGAGLSSLKPFATDLLNLTLASPRVNRYRKRGEDVAQWTPDLNACWFATRTLEARQKYGLTIDRVEAEAVEAVLSTCDSREMVLLPWELAAVQTAPHSEDDHNTDALGLGVHEKPIGGAESIARGSSQSSFGSLHAQ